MTHLTEMLRDMALDNSMSMLPRDQWRWPANAPYLEGLAASLSAAEKETFVCGEHDEQQAMLANKPELKPLDSFLNEAFDGNLSHNFFE